MSRLSQTVFADRVLHQVDESFMKTGPVHETLRALASRLPRENISYAVIGDMAVAFCSENRLNAGSR